MTDFSCFWLVRGAAALSMACALASAGAQTSLKSADAGQSSTAAKSAVKAVPKPAAKPSATRRTDAEPALSPLQLELAKQFFTGFLPCELGKFVIITPDERSPGHFVLSHKGNQYRVAPVESRTGTLRMEDNRGHAVWIQLSNKSMLMDQKAGVRLADDCQSPEQEIVANAYKTNPPQELLDSLRPGTIEARNAAQRAEPPLVTPIERPLVNPYSQAR
jgi:hypothetical protein